jgi:hypothetical protein
VLDTEITACGSCGAGGLVTIIDLGLQPLAERESTPYPLKLLQCGTCSLVQLSYQADPHEVFPEDHPYATGNTTFLRNHFSSLARQLSRHLRDGDVVVDIGANDGTLLAAYPGQLALTRVAVEPTGQAAKCREKGLVTFKEFFSLGVAKDILNATGRAKVITACNVLAHVPDVHGFLEGVRLLLADDGIFITENHDIDSILHGLQVDTIYHEHLRYYSVASLSYLLGMHNLDVSKSELIPSHGGSFRVWARHRENILVFRERARETAAKLHDLVAAAAAEGPVYGIGATTRAVPLMHFGDLAGLVTCVCEVSTSEKIGMLMPGTTIPVMPDEYLIEQQPPHALMFSWHIAGSIIPKLRSAGYRGKFIIPLPEPVIRA